MDSSIPINSILTAANSAEYIVQQTTTIAINTNNIINLVFSAGTATATTAGIHEYASGMTVTISGADQPAYNGVFVIQVTADNLFTYEVSGSPVTPATGTISATANTATVSVVSNDFGEDQNLATGAALTWTTPLPGIDSTAFVQFEGLVGGTDVESTDDFRSRVLGTYQNPNTPFNVEEIIDLAREINGVTRVFVEEPDFATGSTPVLALTQVAGVARATFTAAHELISGMVISISGATQLNYNVSNVVILVDSPTSFIFLVDPTLTSPATGTIFSAWAAVQPGQTKVLFTRDNDPSIIPTASEVLDVYNKLLTIKPAHMSARDLIVVAPAAVPINFNFSSTSPDTPTMRSAIIANLDAFFRQETSVGQTLFLKVINATILNTIDTETGQTLQNFILTSPSTDTHILSGQIPTMGTQNLVPP